MASVVIPWGDKSKILCAFWASAHNATWNSDNDFARLGGYIGGAILLSFAVECAIKGLLEAEGKPITKELRKHNLAQLFQELHQETREKASNVYQSILTKDNDVRLQTAPVRSLAACLETHDNSFMEWRYGIDLQTKFIPVVMAYANISLLTLLYPEQKFTTGSATSSEIEVAGGKVE